MKWAVIADIALVLLVVPLTLSLEGRMPPELVRFHEKQPVPFEEFLDGKVSWLVMVGLCSAVMIVLGALIVSYIGLLNRKQWGARLYLLITVGMLSTYFLYGYAALHPLEQIYTQVGGLVQGLVLGLAFFSDAIDWKSKTAGGEVSQDAPE
ncbi:MAG: hypothetical protein ACRCXD_00830 [Luteolibacter sp.]